MCGLCLGREGKVGQVKMTDKIQTEIKGLNEGQEQLRIEIGGNMEVIK